MAFHFLLIFALLNLVFTGSDATRTKEELHWKSVFPNTPMPKVLQDILPIPGQATMFRGDIARESKGVNDPDFGTYWDGDNSGKDSKGEDVHPTNKGVNDPEFGAYWYDYNYKGSVEKSKGNVSPNNKRINDPEFGAYWYDYNYKGSVEKSKGNISPNNKRINDPEFGAYWYDYNYKAEKSRGDHSEINKAVNDNDVNDPTLGNKYSLGRKSSPDKKEDIKQTIYFFQEGLLPGTKVNLPTLVQNVDRAMFLPQQIADSMPLSSDKLPEILKNFSLKAESSGADYVKVAVKNCERGSMKGEEKYCATSLESFVDLGVSMLGRNIQLLWHEIGKETKNPLFTIDKGVRNMAENDDVVCHKMKYPYAVYLCHSIKKTTVYKVPLVNDDGSKANAVAVCHKDTSAWSPNHIAFRVLKVKPGTVPICHFLGRDTLVWIPN